MRQATFQVFRFDELRKPIQKKIISGIRTSKLNAIEFQIEIRKVCSKVFKGTGISPRAPCPILWMNGKGEPSLAWTVCIETSCVDGEDIELYSQVGTTILFYFDYSVVNEKVILKIDRYQFQDYKEYAPKIDSLKERIADYLLPQLQKILTALKPTIDNLKDEGIRKDIFQQRLEYFEDGHPYRFREREDEDSTD